MLQERLQGKTKLLDLCETQRRSSHRNLFVCVRPIIPLIPKRGTGWIRRWGRANISWPEQSIAPRQGDVEIGTTLGTPFLAKVVRNTVVEVLEYATVIERTLGPVVATVAMLSNAVV